MNKIETLVRYNPKLNLPIYTHISAESNQFDYEVGDKIDVRVRDTSREGDDDKPGDYNYLHECLVIGQEKMRWDEIPRLLKAYDAKARDKKVAESRISPSPKEGTDGDRVMVVNILLRLDKARDFIVSGEESLMPKDIEDVSEYEGNG